MNASKIKTILAAFVLIVSLGFATAPTALASGAVAAASGDDYSIDCDPAIDACNSGSTGTKEASPPPKFLPLVMIGVLVLAIILYTIIEVPKRFRKFPKA